MINKEESDNVGLRPLTECNRLGCHELTRGKYCNEHKDTDQERAKDSNRFYDRFKRNEDTKEFYKSIEWQRERQRALKRDKYLCQRCLNSKKIVAADMVHHINPVERYWELRLDISNLISLCNACHNTIDHKKL
jgi:5-methylcytosine-specific restriction enzyme A